MNKCKKNVLIIFGCLLVIALLIVPYSHEIRVDRRLAFAKKIKVDSYEAKRGWVFWPLLPVSGQRLVIDQDLLTGELVFILLAAGFAYLMCVCNQRGQKNREERLAREEKTSSIEKESG